MVIMAMTWFDNGGFHKWGIPKMVGLPRWYGFNMVMISGQIITTSLFSLTGIMVNKRNHPKMAACFRLVNYCNLPRWYGYNIWLWYCFIWLYYGYILMWLNMVWCGSFWFDMADMILWEIEPHIGDNAMKFRPCNSYRMGWFGLETWRDWRCPIDPCLSC